MSIRFVHPAIEIESTTAVRDREALEDPLYMLKDNVPYLFVSLPWQTKLFRHYFSPLHIKERGVCMSEKEREQTSQSLGMEHHYDSSSSSGNSKANTLS